MIPAGGHLAVGCLSRTGSATWLSPVAGDCAAAVRALAHACADRVILLPLPGDERAQIEQFAREVRPLLP